MALNSAAVLAEPQKVIAKKVQRSFEPRYSTSDFIALLDRTSLWGCPTRRHMNPPRASIHNTKRRFAGILIVIASPENPVYAITTPAAIVGTPPAMARHANHFGYSSRSTAIPYKVIVRPKERDNMLANPISIWRTAKAA